MVTINVLIYTDKTDISLVDDDETKRVTILKKLLETKRLGFADFKLDVINRYENFVAPDSPGEVRKLTKELLEPYDEIWIFGLYQQTVLGRFTEDFGGPENELDKDEVAALERWMTRGGVLISGDHSVFQPGGNESDPINTFQCLGRALGHRVPRAGQLRLWDGPPTVNFDSSFNTLVRTLQDPETNPDLQEDALPQTLILVKFGPKGTPHRVFLGKNETIGIFPDHAHEGEVVIPDKLGRNWPPFGEKNDKKKPRPDIVAFGCDKRFCHSLPVLAVYDGDKLGVGRIAADSSWHHYLNVNLVAFMNPDQAATLELFAQFFQNLALYLAPLPKRQQMSRIMTKWILRHPEVQEERGNHPVAVGRVALHYLSQRTTGGERYELLKLAGWLPPDSDGEEISLPPHGRFDLMPSHELVVGSIVNSFYRAASEQLSRKDKKAVEITEADLIKRGLDQAFKLHGELLSVAASELRT